MSALSLVRGLAGGRTPEPVQHIRERFPRYAEEAAKLTATVGREADLDARRSELVVGISARTDRKQELDDRATALLEGAEVDEADERRRQRLRGDLESIYDELKVTRRALEIQRDIVASESARASTEMQKELRPRFTDICRRIHAGLQQISGALVEAEQLRRAVEDAGYQSQAGDQLPDRLQTLRLDLDNTRASGFVREAEKAGLL